MKIIYHILSPLSSKNYNYFKFISLFNISKKYICENHYRIPIILALVIGFFIAKKKISESCMGRPSPVKGTHYAKRKDMKKVRCIETGVVYDSLNLASADTGDKVQYIYSWCKNGKAPSTCEFHWEYVK